MRKFFILLIIILSLLSLCSCTNSKEEFVLSQIVIDGEPISNMSGNLVLKSDYSGELSINGNNCVFNWSDNPPTITINDLVAQYEKTQTGLNIYLDEGNISLIFTIGPAVESHHDNISVAEIHYEGRFYFSNCEGEWSDYEGRSMFVHGTISNDGIRLFSDYYSSEIPMVDIVLDDNHCLSGYIMAYPLNEYGVRISNEKQNKKDLNNLEFLHPEEYIWNKYLEEEQTEEKEEYVDTIILTGNSMNSEGGFNYRVVLSETKDTIK